LVGRGFAPSTVFDSLRRFFGMNGTPQVLWSELAKAIAASRKRFGA